MSRRRSFANVPQLESAPLKVIVGTGSAIRTFFLHKERATKFSATIAAAVKSEWKEATSGTVTLPEDDPELFEIFAGFIYTGGVHCAKQDDAQNTQDTERARLADLWVFGDKLQAPEFKDAAVDATDESVRSGGAYPRKMHEIVYANSVTTSGMRRLLADMCTWGWAKGSLKDAERGPAWDEFFFDVAAKQHGLYGDRRSNAPFASGGSCLYHDHGSEKPCYKTMFS